MSQHHYGCFMIPNLAVSLIDLFLAHGNSAQSAEQNVRRKRKVNESMNEDSHSNDFKSQKLAKKFAEERQPMTPTQRVGQLAFDAYHEIAELPLLHTDAVCNIIQAKFNPLATELERVTAELEHQKTVSIEYRDARDKAERESDQLRAQLAKAKNKLTQPHK